MSICWHGWEEELNILIREAESNKYGAVVRPIQLTGLRQELRRLEEINKSMQKTISEHECAIKEINKFFSKG